MQLLCCYTPAHEVLYRKVFLPSVPSGMALEATMIDEAGPGDFLSPEFLRCIRRKIELVEASLHKCAKDEILAWSDVDVRFVDLNREKLSEILDSSGADLMFQREAPWLHDVNTGFFICRANNAVRQFFRTVRQNLEGDTSINEQVAVNRLLGTSRDPDYSPRWDYLPRSFYARTHGWPPPRKLSIYHANYTKGPDAVGQKLKQFQELESILCGGLAAWTWSVARRIPEKIGNTLGVLR